MLDATVTVPIFTKVGDNEPILLGDWTLSMSDLAAIRDDPSQFVFGIKPIDA